MPGCIGFVRCGTPQCTNTEAAVNETSTGTLSLSCHRCGFSGFAKPGTRAARNIRAAMTPAEDDEPAPAPAPSPKPAPAPPPPAPPAAKKRAGLLLDAKE